MVGFRFDNFLNGDVSVDDDRLFKVILTEHKRMAINFVKELIQFRDGILKVFSCTRFITA